MGRVRVAGFSVSLDGFGAGPEQSLQDPLGKRGPELHRWFVGTKSFKAMFGAEGGTEGEARQALANITTVLADCGASWGDVAKVTVFVTDIADFPVVNEAYGAAVGDHRPARSTVQVAALPAGAKVEIEVWAHKPV